MTRIRFVTTVPRVTDPSRATSTALEVVRWSDDIDVDGVLLFTGAGAVLDPWIGAATVVARSRRLAPVVALNPMYTHPFAAARSLLSITQAHGRRVDLNLITGAALSELHAIGDELDHRERYARLLEYTELFVQLLDGDPVDFEGRFYRARGLQLRPAVPAESRPLMYLAGRSDDARATAAALGATLMGMPDAAGVPEGLGAVNVGVIARADAQEAENVAAQVFPPDEVGREVLRISMANTDSVWKQALAEAREDVASPIRLTPFHSAQSDCPYLVGDHETVAKHISWMAERGVRTFVLDTPVSREDFDHLAVVVERSRALCEEKTG
ncbi:LLM class flavin-dependent oxidoreductase [Lentzea alba]|uniref:LLM class flavin-dependent oxidoreductase n=1 Tax=Lentzea alba TaxID=2714351 RepID=UPI0039BF57DE